MFNYFKECVTTKFADFKGRSRRSEYWYFMLVQLIVIILAMVIDNVLGTTIKVADQSLPYGYAYMIAGLGLFIPALSAVVRRLHDVGKSGWFYFIFFIPIVGIIWLLVLLCTDSKPGENKWGPNPKGVGNGGNADDLINSIGN